MSKGDRVSSLQERDRFCLSETRSRLDIWGWEKTRSGLIKFKNNGGIYSCPCRVSKSLWSEEKKVSISKNSGIWY
ncbi:MAG: hypothetical protein ACRCT1_13915 [Microcoleaceae cyanobacterium]